MAVLLAGLLTMTAAAVDLDGQVTPTPGSSAVVSSEVISAANEAEVAVVDLLGALSTTGLRPREYLCLVGEGPCPKPPPPALNMAVERRLDCIQNYESHGFAGATNPRSKAAGLFQFLGSTWAGTPQGRAGLSPYDPVAAREAARWMANQGRWREWVPVQNGWC